MLVISSIIRFQINHVHLLWPLKQLLWVELLRLIFTAHLTFLWYNRFALLNNTVSTADQRFNLRFLHGFMACVFWRISLRKQAEAVVLLMVFHELFLLGIYFVLIRSLLNRLMEFGAGRYLVVRNLVLFMWLSYYLLRISDYFLRSLGHLL